jgi:hypothetical protein
LLLLLAYN